MADCGSSPQPRALVFGAGSVGRGFLGQLFSESGYEVVFVDVDDALLAALTARGAYTLRLAGVTGVRELEIGPVSAVDGRDSDAVAAEVAQAAVIATAVGVRALGAIAKPIAQGLLVRWEQREPADVPAEVNVIICENLHDAPEVLGGSIQEALPERARPSMAAHLGLVPAVIARMSPVPTAAQRAEDPTLIVAEPYKVLPVDRDAFVGNIPSIVGMHAVARFEAYTDRKLYIHNAGHALLGYLGAARGHTYGYEAIEDDWVRQRLYEGLAESARALVAMHGFEPVSFQEHIDYLLVRFANRALADPVSRLARDPLRKLRPDDRLVGSARLVERCGMRPEGLAWGIAGALAYVNPEDEHAVALQQQVREQGVTAVLEEVCRIEASEALGELLRARYAQLNEAGR